MSKSSVKDARENSRLRLPSKPFRLSKEELAGSRAGTLGCFPSPDLYEPEEAPTREQLAQPRTNRLGERHAKSGD